MPPTSHAPLRSRLPATLVGGAASRRLFGCSGWSAAVGCSGSGSTHAASASDMAERELMHTRNLDASRLDNPASAFLECLVLTYARSVPGIVLRACRISGEVPCREDRGEDFGVRSKARNEPRALKAHHVSTGHRTAHA
eukprot:2959202-Rhodomonas_salina.1